MSIERVLINESEENAMKIMYWSDYACPYCYIGETHLKKAIENLNLGDQVDVEMLAFELDPTASKEYTGATVDRFAKKYGLSLKGAQERIDGISEMGRAAGLDFHYAETRYTNTFDAHRLTKLVQKKDAGLADRLQERLYKAYFSEGLELADHAVLTRIAVEEGMDDGEVKQLLESDLYADDVRLDEREAQRYGVQGVPYFVVGNKYAIPGALPVESMERVLKNVLDEEAKAAKSAVQGMACGPDGCHFEG